MRAAINPLVDTNATDSLLAPDARPLVGVIHLPPLTGPRAPSLETLLERAATDARHYRQAGFDAVLVENFGDQPFPKTRSAPHVPALMTRVAHHVKETTRLPVGINVLRNDVKSALAIACAVPAEFIRVNVLTGATVTDQGIIEGAAHTLARYRERLGPRAESIFVAADLHVKHGAPLAPRPIEQEAQDAVERAGADLLLATGDATGSPATLEDVARVRQSTPETPVWVASGVTAETIREALSVAQGAIVGSSAKKGGQAANPVDPERALRLAEQAGKTRRTD